MRIPNSRTNRSRSSNPASTNFRESLRLEMLEQRNLMTVTSNLTGGALSIALDANKDAAEVSVSGNTLQVSAEGKTESFSLADVRSINARSLSGADQSIQFGGTLNLSGALNVAGIGLILFATGNYQVGSASVVSPGSIEFSSFQLNASGSVQLTASQTLTSTETGLLGFLGVVSQASNSIAIHDSVISATGISLVAHTEINASADGDDQEDVSRDFARVKTVGTASIIVDGTSNLNSRDRMSLLAESVQTVRASAVATASGASSIRDAALARTNVTSIATIELSDAATLQSTADFSAKARNIVTISTTADGSLAGGGGKGGVLALAEFVGTTTVVVADTVIITAPNVEIKAESNATQLTTAESTVGGAVANDPSTTSELSSDALNTSSGGLGVAGAYARTKSDRTTQVTFSDKASIRATGTVNVLSDASGDTTTSADASNTNNAGNSGDGLGVAIATDRSSNINRVGIDGSLTATGTAINFVAGSTSGDRHTTTAVSGVGAANLGAAGSFARTRVESVTESLLNNLASLDAGGASVRFEASSAPTLATEAKPAGTSSVAAKKGLGASVAQNKLVNTTSARIGNSSSIAGVSNLTVTANAVDTVTANAITGAEGGTSFTPGVATSVVDSNANATVGTGAITAVSGALNIQSQHTGNISSTVAGDVLGEKAAVGGSFALNDVDINSAATLSRTLNAAGAVSIQSSTGGAVQANAKASAKGTGPTTKTSDQQSLEEQQAAGSDDSIPSADAKGKVTAGAATAINLVDVHANASIDLNAILTSEQTISIAASNSVDSIAKADASAVGAGTTQNGSTTGGTERGLAIAVAINRADTIADARVHDRSNLFGRHGVNIASNTTVGADTGHTLSAEAISGAGGRKTGFAGSFALNKVLNESSAIVMPFARVNGGDGGTNLISDNTASNTASATPKTPTTGGEHGVGASFALNIAENKSLAQMSA